MMVLDLFSGNHFLCINTKMFPELCTVVVLKIHIIQAPILKWSGQVLQKNLFTIKFRGNRKKGKACFWNKICEEVHRFIWKWKIYFETKKTLQSCDSNNFLFCNHLSDSTRFAYHMGSIMLISAFLKDQETSAKDWDFYGLQFTKLPILLSYNLLPEHFTNSVKAFDPERLSQMLRQISRVVQSNELRCFVNFSHQKASVIRSSHISYKTNAETRDLWYILLVFSVLFVSTILNDFVNHST